MPTRIVIARSIATVVITIASVVFRLTVGCRSAAKLDPMDLNVARFCHRDRAGRPISDRSRQTFAAPPVCHHVLAGPTRRRQLDKSQPPKSRAWTSRPFEHGGLEARPYLRISRQARIVMFVPFCSAPRVVPIHSCNTWKRRIWLDRDKPPLTYQTPAGSPMP
jgi:hypothetical protein